VIVQPTAEALDQREDLLDREPAGRAPGWTEPANGLPGAPRAVSRPCALSQRTNLTSGSGRKSFGLCEGGWWGAAK
jgi:hypothetical protein